MNRQIVIGAVFIIAAVLWSRRANAAQSQLLPYPSQDNYIDGEYELIPEYDFYPQEEIPPYVIDIQEPQAMAFQLPPNPTRGERNNNPGNIEKSNNAWQGKILGNDVRFETFDSPQMGVRALARLLMNYINGGNNTIAKIINKYAPSSENNTNAYISAVVRDTGIQPYTLLTDHPDTINRLVHAIIQHENGRNIYADTGIIEQGIALA